MTEIARNLDIETPEELLLRLRPIMDAIGMGELSGTKITDEHKRLLVIKDQGEINQDEFLSLGLLVLSLNGT